MILYTHCKINLGLSVIARREDGFSQIETVLYPLSAMSDIVEIVVSDRFRFTSSGIAVDCPVQQNLCVKAYRLMAAKYGITTPINMHLHKTIPFGAGLGAGSANAVGVIKLLDAIFNIGMSPSDMMTIAAMLGSDTSFFVKNTAAIARGRGELLEPMPLTLAGYYIVLAKTDVAISTGQAYRAVTPHEPTTTPGQCAMQPIESWRKELINDFETPIFAQFPKLRQIKEKLYELGAIYTSMSGSGSTIYGIFRDNPCEKINTEGCFNNIFLRTFTIS